MPKTFGQALMYTHFPLEYREYMTYYVTTFDGDVPLEARVT